MASRVDKPLLKIDLGAIKANYRALSDYVAPAQVAAVVKADAYGLGMVRVAQALWEAGCRHFYVAFIEGGLQLRQLLPQARVSVLHGVTAGIEKDMATHRLVPVLNHLGQMQHWQTTARERDERLPASFHIDTGMNRLGWDVEAFHAQMRDGKPEAISMTGLMSHLACADQPKNAMNQHQLQQAQEIRPYWRQVPFSLANSGGVMLGREYHMDEVRTGAALYGVHLKRGEMLGLQHVVTLKAPILQ